MANKTTVFRVQDVDGRGPWKPGFSSKWVEDREDPSEFDKLLPIYAEFPNLQTLLRPGFHVGVGCTSIEQLKRWITRNEYKTLKKHGYKCVAIKVDKIVAESAIQCVFERKAPLRIDCRLAKFWTKADKVQNG